jgi:inosose dehydratase
MGEIELALHISAWSAEDDFVRALAGVSDAGYRAMEAQAVVVPEYEDRVAVFQEMLSRQDVTLTAVETHLRPITLELLEEEIERCANVARFLRANRSELLVLHPPVKRPEGDDAEDWKLAIEAINQIGRRTLDLDVRTCIHPSENTIAENRRDVERLFKQTDEDAVRVCADTGFLMWAGISPAHFFKKFGKRIDYVHLRDVKKPRALKSGPSSLQPATFGKGAVKMEAIAKRLEAIDYSGWVTIEYPGDHTEPVAAAAAAREIARRVLNLI